MKTKKIYQKGITLVELMIALALSAFLISGMIQIFNGSKQTFLLQQGLVNIQENARFTLDILSKDLRMAGYSGCSREVKIANNLVTPVYMGNLTVPIVGYETSGGGTYTAPTGIDWADLPTNVRSMVTGFSSDQTYSDIITLRRTSSQGVNVSEGMTQPTEDIKLVNLSDFEYPEADTTVYIGDCDKGSIFQVTGITVPSDTAESVTVKHAAGSGSTGNETSSLFPSEGKWQGLRGFDTDAALYKLSGSSVVYFVAPSDGCSDVLSLWRSDGDDDPQELIPGIETVEILYGVDSNKDGTPNRYSTADNIDLTVTENYDGSRETAEDIVSVRIKLTVNSIEDLDGEDPITREFTQTFKVRNEGGNS
ncbi:hypothetical protein A9Q99_09155 [Gammaproteobacteria bacterium 45_16_T64]|nr:hypothetical protein A9Q99_09155 [Gammaproteobacteria bacterium 45_16_T64]